MLRIWSLSRAKIVPPDLLTLEFIPASPVAPGWDALRCRRSLQAAPVEYRRAIGLKGMTLERDRRRTAATQQRHRPAPDQPCHGSRQHPTLAAHQKVGAEAGRDARESLPSLEQAPETVATSR